MSEKPIPPDSIEYNRRATVAGLYSQVLRAISRKMLNEDELAQRTGRPVEAVRRRLASMKGWTLNDVSDFLLACDMEPRIEINPEESSDNGSENHG